MLIQKTKTAAIILIFAIVSLHASAQKDSINYDSLANLTIQGLLELQVSGVSKFIEHSDDAPATIIVITEEQLKKGNCKDLSDVLKFIPGFDITDNARGFGEYYIIRGIEGNDRFLVLIDGEKINPASGTFLSIGNSISVNFAQRIEIIYGPTSVMYGADAFSGVINIISKQTNEKINISSSVDYGTQNTLISQIYLGYKPAPELSFTFSGQIYKSDGPNFLGKDTIYDIINYYEAPLVNKFEQEINDHTLFFNAKYKAVSLSFFRQSFDEGNALGMSPQYYIYNKENKWKQSNNLLWFSYNKSFSAKSEISYNMAFVNHTQNPETMFEKWADKPLESTIYKQYMTGLDNSFKSFLSHKFDFNKKIQLISGIEYEYNKSIPPYANDEVLGRSFKYENEYEIIIKNTLNIEEHRIAALAQLKIKPSPYLSLVAGGRIDYSKRYKQTFNPRLSAIFSGIKNTSVKALYGTAFQAPSLFYQYEQFGTPVAVMLSVSEVQKTQPDWYLENQKVQTSELSINHQLTKKINLRANIFYNYLTNLIQRNQYTDSAYNKYFSSDTQIIYSKGIRNENSGTAETYGMIIIADFIINKKIKTSVSYMYTDGRVSKKEKYEEITKIAQHKFWLNTIIPDIYNKININVKMKLVGKINNNDLIEFPDGKKKGYFDTDVNVNINQIFKNIDFDIKFINIFNQHYYQPGILEGVVYLNQIPQNGFNMLFGLDFNFNGK